MQIDRSENNCFTEKKNIFLGRPNFDVVSKSSLICPPQPPVFSTADRGRSVELVPEVSRIYRDSAFTRNDINNNYYDNDKCIENDKNI